MAIEEGLAYWTSAKSPNTKFEPVYQTNLVVDRDTAEKYRAEGCSIREMEEGPALVIKRKVNGPNGMVRNAPKLFDKDKKPLDELVGNGSKVRVQFNPFDWEYAGKSGRSLDFQAMQVLELVTFEGRSADGAELGYEDTEDGSEF
jgi:hypothetical protein|tara:strand:- start:467 stop:901 length:435 start_codon:yes stop_codon:yes gene_type:complete